MDTLPKRNTARTMQGFTNMQGLTTTQGFTIPELMVVVAIMAILLSLAVPAFNNTIRDNRVLASSNELVTAVAMARSEAVKRARMAAVCPSADGASCGADWSTGFIVYVEKDTVVAGGAPDVDIVLKVNGEMNATVGTQTAGANNWIRFSSRGIADELVTLEIKPETCESGNSFQELTISLVGRATFTKKTC